MGTDAGDWRSRRFAATHRRIYDGALALFRAHGFEQVSIGQIAKAAQVSVPTFYAHFPSKEHLIMQVPSAHDFAAFLAGEPSDVPLAARMRRAVPLWISRWTPEFREDALARWRIVAATPSLRTRAAEFERTTGDVVTDALPTAPGEELPQSVIVNAYLSAYTAALLAWADGDGQRNLEDLVDEAFDVLERR